MKFKNGDIVRLKSGYCYKKQGEINNRYAVVGITETGLYIISRISSGFALGEIEVVDEDTITSTHIYYFYEEGEVLTDWDLTIIYDDLKAMGEVEDESVEDYIANCTTGNGQLDTYTNITDMYTDVTR